MSAKVAMTVHVRPPKTGTARVWGTLRTAPTRVTTDSDRNFCSGVVEKPCSGIMNGTSTDQMLHTEKPMCSEAMEAQRLRRATWRPVSSQNRRSSGSQWEIRSPTARGARRPVSEVTSGAFLLDGGRPYREQEGRVARRCPSVKHERRPAHQASTAVVSASVDDG